MSKTIPIKTRKLKELFRTGEVVDTYIKDEIGRPFVRGEIGQAVRFDGANDYIRLPYFINPTPNDITFSVVTKFDENTSGSLAGRCIMSCGTWGGGDAIYLGIEDSGDIYGSSNLIVGIYNLGWHVIDSGFQPVIGTLYKIQVVINASGAELFVNGTSYGTTANIPASNINVCEWLIGDRHDAAHHSYFAGTIFDVRLYNQELTSDELTSVRNYENIESDNLVGWWKLNEESSDNVAVDSSGNDYDGTWNINDDTYSFITQNLVKFDDNGLGRDTVQGSCLELDTARWIEATFTAEQDHTIEFYYQHITTPGTYPVLFSWGTYTYALYLEWSADGNITYFKNGSISKTIGFATVLKDGDAHKVKLIKNGIDFKLYIDDDLFGVWTDTVTVQSNITIGGDKFTPNATTYVNANIFDFKVLDSNNILKLHLKMDESDGDVLFDSSGDDNSISIKGTPTWSTQDVVSFADTVGYAKGLQLLKDGDMENSGVTAWFGGNISTLSKETSALNGGSQCLRVTKIGSWGNAYQQNLVVGVNYRVRGYARGDGSNSPRLVVGTSTEWLGTTSTDWQYFDITHVANTINLQLYKNELVDGYVEFNDVKVEAVDIKYPVVAKGPSGAINVPSEHPNLFENGDAAIDDTSMFTTDGNAGLIRIKENNTSNNYIWRLFRNADTNSTFPAFYQSPAIGTTIKVSCKVRTDGVNTASIYTYGATPTTYISTSYTDDNWFHYSETFTTVSAVGLIFRTSAPQGGNGYAEFKDIVIEDLDQELANGYTALVTSPDGVLNYTEIHGGRVNYNLSLVNNNCLDLDGSTNYVNAPAIGGTSVIVMACNYVPANVTGTRVILQKRVSAILRTAVYTNGATLQVFIAGIGSFTQVTGFTLAIGTDYRIDTEISVGKLVVIVNGVREEYSLAITDPSLITDYYNIGHDGGGGNLGFGKIYNVNFDDACYYPCAEGAGTIIYDVSGNDNHGTWTGTPGFSTQDLYAYNTKYGYTLSGSTYIPALLNGSNGADGNPIGQIGGKGYNQCESSIKFADNVAELVQADINDEVFFSSGTAQELDATVFDADIIDGKHGYFIKDHGNRSILSVFDERMQPDSGIFTAQGSGGVDAGILCGDVLDMGLSDLEMECYIIIPTGYTPVIYESIMGKGYIGSSGGRYFLGLNGTQLFVTFEGASILVVVAYNISSLSKDVPVKINVKFDRDGLMELLINDSVVDSGDISGAVAYNMVIAVDFQLLGTDQSVAASAYSFRGKMWGAKIWIDGVLKGKWDLNGNTYDSSGYGNHGTWTVDIPEYSPLTDDELKLIDYSDPMRENGFSIGDNIVLNSNDLTQSTWTKRGTVIATYNQADPFGGTSASKLTGFGIVGVNDIYQIVSGLSGKGTYEPSFWVKPVTMTGNLNVQNPNASANGQWTIDYNKLVSGEWNYITKAHPAVTVVSEFVLYNATNSGLLFSMIGVSSQGVHFYGCEVKEYFIPADESDPTNDVLGNTLTNPAKNGLTNNAPATFNETATEIIKQITYRRGE